MKRVKSLAFGEEPTTIGQRLIAALAAIEPGIYAPQYSDWPDKIDWIKDIKKAVQAGDFPQTAYLAGRLSQLMDAAYEARRNAFALVHEEFGEEDGE